jgi:hypothetical protein
METENLCYIWTRKLNRFLHEQTVPGHWLVEMELLTSVVNIMTSDGVKVKTSPTVNGEMAATYFKIGKNFFNL